MCIENKKDNRYLCFQCTNNISTLFTLDWQACISNQDFERLRMKNNETCVRDPGLSSRD